MYKEIVALREIQSIESNRKAIEFIGSGEPVLSVVLHEIPEGHEDVETYTFFEIGSQIEIGKIIHHPSLSMAYRIADDAHMDL